MVKTVAPAIGTALGGPFAGVATKFLADKLLGEDAEGASQDDLEAKLEKLVQSGDPAILTKMKELDNDFKVKMKELGIKETGMYLADRSDARQREIVLRDWTPRALAGAVTVGFFGILFTLIFVKVEGTMLNVLNILLGSLGTAWTTILNYYFGSSKSSDMKDIPMMSQQTGRK